MNDASQEMEVAKEEEVVVVAPPAPPTKATLDDPAAAAPNGLVPAKDLPPPPFPRGRGAHPDEVPQAFWTRAHGQLLDLLNCDGVMIDEMLEVLKTMPKPVEPDVPLLDALHPDRDSDITLLQLTVIKGNRQAFDLLIKYGANIEAVNSKFSGVIQMLAKRGLHGWIEPYLVGKPTPFVAELLSRQNCTVCTIVIKMLLKNISYYYHYFWAGLVPPPCRRPETSARHRGVVVAQRRRCEGWHGQRMDPIDDGHHIGRYKRRPAPCREWCESFFPRLTPVVPHQRALPNQQTDAALAPVQGPEPQHVAGGREGQPRRQVEGHHLHDALRAGDAGHDAAGLPKAIRSPAHHQRV